MNTFRKAYLKLFDHKKYHRLKQEEQWHDFLDSIRAVNAQDVSLRHLESCSFIHSGHCGDIIYALPGMAALSRACGCGKYTIYLNINAPLKYSRSIVHPYGNVLLNEAAFSMLRPLLEHQADIASCDRYAGQAVDFDMDLFRRRPILVDRGDIAHWNALIFPIGIDTSVPWLSVPPSPVTRGALVIARSTRYRMPLIDYGFLRRYGAPFFVGLESEFREMRESVPTLRYLPCKNFLEMASYIAGAKLFIGNQSFPFALAEALKVPRLLETYYLVPNVLVAGRDGYMFCFQNCFEDLVRQRMAAGE